jgi:hypothetical protein
LGPTQLREVFGNGVDVAMKKRDAASKEKGIFQRIGVFFVYTCRLKEADGWDLYTNYNCYCSRRALSVGVISYQR